MRLRANDAAPFPHGEQAAHGEHGSASQLCQLLAGKSDLETAIYALTHLLQQSNDFLTQTDSDLLGGRRTNTIFHPRSTIADDLHYIVPEGRKFQHVVFENIRFPDEHHRRLHCTCTGAMANQPAIRKYPNDLAWSTNS